MPRQGGEKGVQMFWTYIIQNILSNRRYIGCTSDLEKRLAEHNRRKTTSTRYAKGNWKLIYSEQYETYSEALAREKMIKSYKGGEALKKLLNAGLVHR